MADAYRDDLAYIHDAGFGNYARQAAPVLLDALHQAGADRGLVVELGCGSGILSEAVAAAGFDVEGVDLSPAMIAMAQQRVPHGRFRVGSILDAELPPCVGVAAVGEIVNYLFDENNSRSALGKLLRRVFAALAPRGVLLFDVAGPGRVPGKGPSSLHRQGDDWAVLVTATEDRKREVLTRQITSFRKVGDLYRRDYEEHRLRLYPPADVADMLRTVGFRVRRLRRYGTLPLPRGVTGFLARKPGK